MSSFDSDIRCLVHSLSLVSQTTFSTNSENVEIESFDCTTRFTFDFYCDGGSPVRVFTVCIPGVPELRPRLPLSTITFG